MDLIRPKLATPLSPKNTEREREREREREQTTTIMKLKVKDDKNLITWKTLRIHFLNSLEAELIQRIEHSSIMERKFCPL